MKHFVNRLYKRKNSPYWWFEVNTEPKTRKSTKILIKGGGKANAQKVADDYTAELNYGGSAPDKNIELCDYLKQFIDICKGSVQPNTYEHYKQTVYNHIIPYFQPYKIKLRELTGDHITKFLYELKRNGRVGGGELSDTSVKKYRGVLGKALQKAVQSNLIPYNPINNSSMPVSIMDNRITEYNTYSLNELRCLLDESKKYDGDYNADIFLFVLLIVTTGCRKGEILGLTWDNVNFENNTIKIVQSRTGNKSEYTHKLKSTKTISSNRIIGINEQVKQELKKEYDKQQYNKKIYGSQYVDILDLVIRNQDGSMPAPNSISGTVGKIMKRAGLPKITVHELRHTFATISANEMGYSIDDISKTLGHSEIRTTQRIYINHSLQTNVEVTNGFCEKLFHNVTHF